MGRRDDIDVNGSCRCFDLASLRLRISMGVALLKTQTETGKLTCPAVFVPLHHLQLRDPRTASTRDQCTKVSSLYPVDRGTL